MKMERPSLQILVLLMCCYAKIDGAIIRDVPIVLKWVSAADRRLHLCLNAESLSMGDGKKLITYVGNCCDYPKFIWKSSGEIYDENNRVCLAKSSIGAAVKFTKKSAECEKFTLNARNVLQIMNFPVNGIFCLHQDSSEEHIYQLCLESAYSFTIAGNECKTSTVDETNLWQRLTGRLIADLKYCWYPESFSDGKTLKDSKYKDCCQYRFSYKSDRTMFVHVNGDTSEEFCLQIDGMPHKKYSDLDGKNIKLKEDCKGSAYVYYNEFGLLRIEGTNRCLFRTTSNVIEIRKCYSTYPFRYEKGQCTAQSSSPSLTVSSSAIPSSKQSLSSIQPSTSFAAPTSRHVESTVLLSSVFSFRFSSITPSGTSLISKFTTLFPTSSSSSSVTATKQVLSSVTRPSWPFDAIFLGDPINGNWGDWTPWSLCPVKCGNGFQERYRYCDNPLPKNGGNQCIGNGHERKSCALAPCTGENLAGVGENCLERCQKLGLACSSSNFIGNSNQAFGNANITCSADDSGKVWTRPYEPAVHINNSKCCGYISIPHFVDCEARPENGTLRLCSCFSKGDKGFYPWTPWSECRKTCGGGRKLRTRLCINYTLESELCKGEVIDTKECNVQKCPVNGGFTEWSGWTSCSKSCDGGTRSRNRTCSNPFPAYGGALCYGNYIERESCGVGFCPINGAWSSWTVWAHCNKPCNQGNVTRRRWCVSPPAMYGGIPCGGVNHEETPCNTNQCPNITMQINGLVFIDTWRDEYENLSSSSFSNYATKIESNVKEMFKYDFPDSFNNVELHRLSVGSVVASFTMYFAFIDSFQTLLLMDAIELDKYLGKLPLASGPVAVNYTTFQVPSSAPANVTAVSNSASTIDVSWNDVPVSDRNGAITGYLVFYREMIATSYTTTATMQLNTTIRGLAAGTDYALRVLAYNANGNGIASDVIVLRTKEKAPSLPPQSLSVVTMSAFSLFVEWTHPPSHSWNGVIKGYKLHVKSDDGSFTRSFNVDGNSVFMNVNELNPYTLYIVDVCAFTSAGDGPFLRSFNKTFVSPPSKPPGNPSCQNRTNTKSIIVSFDPVAMDFIHGILKGYRIEYRLLKRGLQPKLNERFQFKMVSPFDKQATIQKLKPNSVYEIRVMAVNEHGIGVKSSPIYGETCPCPKVVFTNYASTVPYIYRDSKGDMRGIFETFLRNITSDVCGFCNGISSKIDFVNDGKNGWADKGTIKRVNEGIDDYVHMSFAIAGRAEMPEFIGKPYVSLIAHPGMVLYTTKTTTEEHLNYMLGSLFQLWPIFIINIVFIVVAGIIFAALTTEDIFKENPCFFLTGSFRGMYWAYVTMFTHGYGDIAPDKVISRIFAVIWILVGLVTSAILIGAISTALTSSATHMEARLYDIELATLHGSKEEIVGINRNAKVNSKKNYSKIEDVHKALKNREVEAALVDAFVAASRPDLFSDDGIIARKMIKYSYTYGIVLSGDMENTNLNIKNYVSDNRQYITQMIENTTPRLPTKFQKPAAISLFDPSSPFLRSTVVILCVIFAVLFTLGWMYDIFTKHRKQKRRKVVPGETERLKKSQMICEEFFNNVQELYRKMELKDEENLQKLNKMKSFMKNEIDAFILLHRKRKKREKFDNISRLLISHQVVRISQEQSSEI